MRIFFILLSIFALISCSRQDTTPLKQTRDDKTFTMVVEVVPQQKMKELCTKLGVQYDANGCAAFNLDTKICTIYVMPLRYQDDQERMAIIGHETWHCRYGKWHD